MQFDALVHLERVSSIGFLLHTTLLRADRRAYGLKASGQDLDVPFWEPLWKLLDGLAGHFQLAPEEVVTMQNVQEAWQLLGQAHGDTLQLCLRIFAVFAEVHPQLPPEVTGASS